MTENKWKTTDIFSIRKLFISTLPYSAPTVLSRIHMGHFSLGMNIDDDDDDEEEEDEMVEEGGHNVQ